jgi:YggT family protein
VTNSALGQLGGLLSLALNIYIWVVVARLILSWFQPNLNAPVSRFLIRATDPALDTTRRLVPLRLGGLDLSPIVLLIALNILAFLAKACLTWLGAGLPMAGIWGLLALGLLQALRMLTWFLILIMIARVIISLVNPNPYNPVVMMVRALSEPLLEPLRRSVPARGPGGVDPRALIVLGLLLIFYTLVLGNLDAPLARWLVQLQLAKRPVEPNIW